MNDTFVTALVGIHHEGHPVRWQRGAVDSKAMVLRRNVAARISHVNARLVHATIAKFHLVRRCASCQAENMITQADAENRSAGALLPDGAHVLDGCHDHRRIARTIAEEKAIE